jgi:epoxyqueuosine reductase
MCQHDLTVKIRDKALELGFESCGIIGLDELRGYEEMLDQRIEACPKSKPMLGSTKRYARPETTYPWAKAVVICITRYGKYKIPKNLEGLIGKYYMYDHKLQPDSRVTKSIAGFEAYLAELGIRSSKELHGVTAMRWAAHKAGLGIIRKNNFLFTKHGSWVIIDSWVIDQELELMESNDFAACPENCTKCIDACPTGALSGPFCMDASGCITALTWGAPDLLPESLSEATEKWIYGCDACQNACPKNSGTWTEEEELPGLADLADKLSLSNILSMDEKTMKELLLPKFWFIQPEKFWLWKVNALRAMTNDFKPEYKDSIMRAAEDENEKVREMAVRSIKKLGLVRQL